MKHVLPLAVMGWLACGIWTAGVWNASFRAQFPTLASDARWSRQNLSMGIAFGLMFGPLGVLISAGITGGWQDGWSLSTHNASL